MKHILHADRSSLFKKILKTQSAELGLEYRSSSSIKESFSILKEESIDLILTSTELDHESGEDLIHALNASSYKDIPVVLITSDEHLATRSRFFDLGIVDYVLKQDLDSKRLSYFFGALQSRRSLTSELQNLRFTVLDDSALSQKIITSILSFHQAEYIRTFDDPINLLAESEPSDVYLIDMIIPRMSGEEVVQTLRSRYPDSIIIAISSVNNIKTISYVLDGGADDYIIKPYDAGLFLARLRNCIRTQSLVRDLKTKQEALEEQARTDGLTGLYNHKFIMERLGEEVREASAGGNPLSVMLLDLDFFKKVNDTYGHPVGDDVLRNLASLLKEHAVSDCLVARYGGEEFLLLMPGVSLEEAVAHGEILLEKVRTHNFRGVDHPLTISAGAAGLKGADPKELVKQADDMLYSSKKNGRDRISF